ncbi:MAG: carboxypeptidase regulatory-like domain-containing protein [Terracidiphilus sp.]
MKRFLSIVFAFVFLAAVAGAQETRATFTGQVADPTGAIVPGASITVTNMLTGAKTEVKSNSTGNYTVPFLNPGTYEVSASQTGFKKYVHTGLVLQTEQTVTENIVLQLGAVDQTVTVTAQTPLVDTSDADTGQTLTAEEVEDLPSNGRSPLGYAHLEYGAVAKGKHSMSQVRPFDNSTADDFSLGGGNSSSNELLLNGVPNMEDSGRTAGFSPELDAVDAIHADEFSANAALGDTSGGIVNITTKAGTNQFHGSASEYYNGSRPFEAEPYFTSPGTTITSTHFNQYAATIGGPVTIPHVVQGHNKLFFFYAFEGYKGNSPATTITSVPTQAERNGDFSALLGVTAADQLYNPFVGQSVTNGSSTYWQRPAIPDNQFTNAGLQVDPVAAAYLKMIPLPNYTGPAAKPDGEDNYYAYDPTINNYESNMGRVDLNISDSDKIYFEAHRSYYDNAQSNIFNNALSGTTSTVVLWGGQVDNVKTFSPSLNLETRLGFSRYETNSGPDSLGLSPTSVGFAGYLASNSTALALPYMTFTDSAAIPSLSGNPGNSEYFDDIQLFASLNKTWGHHSFKFGPDIRLNKDSVLSPGQADGQFTFKASNEDFVTESPNNAALGVNQAFGGALALFELGLPSSAAYNLSTKFQYDNWYAGFFAQDDWKALPTLNISIGVRLEHETPVVETHNLMVSGWNSAENNVVTTPATANYAAIYPTAPAPGNADLPAPGSFAPTGGIIYATGSNRSPYSPAGMYWSPRIGFAWSPGFSHGTLAVRGGAGIYVNPFSNYDHGQAYGYAQASNMDISLNNNETPDTTMDDPFPIDSTNPDYNPIQPRLGSYFGINTNLGSGIVYYAPVKVPYAEKFSLDVQKQFARNWMAEIGAIRVVQIHGSFSNNVSATTMVQYLSHTPAANSPDAISVADAMTTKVSNPFLGTMPGYTSATGAAVPNTTGLNTSKTLTVSQLVDAYPEYSGITEQLIPGQYTDFNALLAQLTQRMSNGLEFTFNLEWSRQLGTTTQLNQGGPLNYEETSSDFPLHASVIALYQLPFGKGRTFLHNSNLLDELVGGWELTSIYQYLSGTPLGWGNANYSGNFTGFDNNPHITGQASFNTAGFDRVSADQPGSYNYRTFPANLLRSDATKNFDFSILKNFTIGDRIIVQPRVDAFNAFNRPQFSSASVSPTASSFAYITGQLNTGRSLQGGVHIRF